MKEFLSVGRMKAMDFWINVNWKRFRSWWKLNINIIWNVDGLRINMFKVLSYEAFTFLTARIRLSHAMRAKFPEIMVWPIRGQYWGHVIRLYQSEECMLDDTASWYHSRFHIFLRLECNDWSIIIILHHRDSQQTDRTGVKTPVCSPLWLVDTGHVTWILASDWSRHWARASKLALLSQTEFLRHQEQEQRCPGYSSQNLFKYFWLT